MLKRKTKQIRMYSKLDFNGEQNKLIKLSFLIKMEKSEHIYCLRLQKVYWYFVHMYTVKMWPNGLESSIKITNRLNER